jgi:hypothetical protein
MMKNEKTSQTSVFVPLRIGSPARRNSDLDQRSVTVCRRQRAGRTTAVNRLTCDVRAKRVDSRWVYLLGLLVPAIGALIAAKLGLFSLYAIEEPPAWETNAVSPLLRCLLIDEVAPEILMVNVSFA